MWSCAFEVWNLYRTLDSFSSMRSRNQSTRKCEAARSRASQLLDPRKVYTVGTLKCARLFCNLTI